MACPIKMSVGRKYHITLRTTVGFSTSLALLLLFSFLGKDALGQAFRFKHLTTKDGLSNNQVKCIMQDNKGLMWFGTYNGLNCYDGYKFTQYFAEPRNRTSIHAHDIMQLHEDKDENIWVVFGRKGVDRFNPNTGSFKHFYYDKEDPYSLSDDQINVIFKDPDGTLWFGTENGFCKYNSGPENFTRYLHKTVGKFSNVTSITKDYHNQIWVASSNGLYVLKPNSNQPILFKDNVKSTKTILLGEYQSVIATRDSTLVLGTLYGLSYLNKSELKNKAQEGQFKKLDLENFGLPSLCNEILQVVQSKNNDLWLNTRGGPVQIKQFANKPKVRFYDVKLKDSKGNANMNAFVEGTNGNIFVGTAEMNLGLIMLDPNSGEVTKYLHNPNDPGSISNNYVHSIYEDRSGVLWVGTLRGNIDRVDLYAKQIDHHHHITNEENSICNNDVYAIMQDKSENTWVGTIHGLTRIDALTGAYSHFFNAPTKSRSLMGRIPGALHETRNGNIWIGYFDRQLVRSVKPKDLHILPIHIP